MFHLDNRFVSEVVLIVKYIKINTLFNKKNSIVQQTTYTKTTNMCVFVRVCAHFMWKKKEKLGAIYSLLHHYHICEVHSVVYYSKVSKFCWLWFCTLVELEICLFEKLTILFKNKCTF